MRVCYFGSPDRHLFGIFDEPASSYASDVGVVLCYPFGADYSAAFRSFRNLATRLARSGFHVLRFDYLGTGDSSGDVEDASVSRWIGDVACAVQEIKDAFQLREVTLVGLNLGATLAALAATDCQHVNRLVLWEPVINGRDYIAYHTALHRAWIGREVRNGRRVRSADNEMLGYQLTQRLRRDVEGLTLFPLTRAPAQHVYVLGNALSDECILMVEHLRAVGTQVDVELVEAPSGSAFPKIDERFESGTRAIAAWLAGAPP
jgi:pimeloyl-ACP methyl ester carboxylesterase